MHTVPRRRLPGDRRCGGGRQLVEGDAGVDVVRVRPFNHTGVGQRDVFVAPEFARQVAEIEQGRRELGHLRATSLTTHDVETYQQARKRDGRAPAILLSAIKPVR